MDYLVREFLEYYHEERPHQGKENNRLAEPKKRKREEEPPPDLLPLSQIRCQKRLGGLLKHYYRKAA